MSGAAGAPAPLAPANGRFRIMSALTLLSVPASIVPGPLQGSAGEVASGFEALLAVETGEASVASETSAGPVAGLDKDDVPAEAFAALGFLNAPVVMPPPPSGPAPTGQGDPTVEPDGIAAGGAVVEAAVPTPAVEPDGPQGATPPLGETPPSAKTDDLQVRPPIADARSTPSARTGDLPVQTRLAEVRLPSLSTGDAAPTVAAAAAAPEAVPAEARAVASPVAAPPPMAGPLRPLTERTSRPLESPVAGIGDTLRESPPAKAAVLATTPALTPPIPRPGPADAVAGPAVAEVSSSEGGPAEFLSGEGAAPPADTPAVSRDPAVSHLSRATIEATAQIAAQILRRLEGRSTRFEMALTPDELGRVDVKLDIDSEGRLNARLAFDNPAAATDLRGRADELRRQLEEAGFHLAEDAFEFAERDSGSSAFDRGQDARNGQSRAFTAAARLNAEIDVAQPPRWMALSLSPSGVDMKV